MLRRLALACLLATAAVVHAQYPSRPILLVVPYTAGSDADLAARHLAQHAPRYLVRDQYRLYEQLAERLGLRQ